MDRRRLLGLLGGAVALAACGKDDPRPRASPGTASPGTASPASPGAGPRSGAPGSGLPTAKGSPGAALTVDSFVDAGACDRTPEQSEGPYYLDVDALRSDIREDRQGMPLRLGVRVIESGPCTAIRDAVFEVWHCDAEGAYSGVDGGAPGRFLRGAQATNAEGIAEIRTIFPGCYPGRTAHVHAKVFVGGGEALTTQLYFDDAVADEVYARAPYAVRDRARNTDDRIFSQDTVMTVTRDGDGLLALLTIGVAR